MERGRGVSLALFVSLLSAGFAFAQSTATLQGTITDQSGAALAGAKVTIHNEATGEERTTTTDTSGLYAVPALPVGSYQLTVAAPNFRPVTVNHIVLQVSRTVQQNVTMNLAATTEVVNVSGQVSSIDTSSTSVGEVIDQRSVQNIPLNGRHFVDLGLLTAGSVTPPQNGFLTAPLRGQGSFGMNTAGGREDTVNFMINGINLNDMAQNQVTFQPTINTVSEFKVDNSTFSAEYGRSSGAIENIATRAGTNTLHGELYDFFRNNDLDARNYFNKKPIPMSPFKRNQFGGDVGGPIWKNHTFFFLSYEGLRQRQGITINQPVLTAAQRQQAQAVGNPTTLKLLPYIPAPNFGSSLFAGSATAPVDIDQGTANISHTFSEADRLNGYYVFQADLRQEPTLQGNNIPGFGDTRQSHRQLLTLTETHVVSPTVVNEARLGYNRIHITFAPNTLLNPADFGMNVGINTAIGLPQITLADILLNFGGPAGFPQGRGDYTAVANDTLSVTRGKHSLAIGGEFRRFNGNNFAETPGTLLFNTVSDFINGNITAFTASPSNISSRIFASAAGAFVQDSFKMTRSFTLELGLRYDWFGTPTEADNRFVEFLPSTGALVRVGQGISQAYQQNALNFQPRVGFAWDVFGNGKTVVRSAYAILTDQPIANLVGYLTTNPPFSNPVSFNGPGTITFANAITAAHAAGSLSPVTVDPHFKNDYVQSYNFNIQQQLPSNVALMAGYFGNKGTHLRTALNLNQFQPGTTVRPYPAVATNSPILPGARLSNIPIWDSNGNSDYNALWVTATKSLSRGLQFITSYTWSKSIDATSLNSAVTAGIVTVQNSYDLRGDRGLSDFDARHRFSFGGVYALPFGHRRLIQGWNLSVTAQLQSGNPFTIVTTNGTVNGIAGTVRPNVLGPVPVGLHPAANGNIQYFPSAACTTPVSGCLFQAVNGFGNLGRNALIGPGFEDVDTSLYKDTRLWERFTAEFRADFFNVMNHPNFGQPNRVLSTAPNNTFGQISTTRFPVGDWGSSRQIQLALKLMF